MRTRDEILQKIKQFEKFLDRGQHPDFENYQQGSLSALYWTLKMKNPYTGRDFGVED